MKSLSLLSLAFCVFFVSLLSLPEKASADEIQPAIYILLDTSGSMIETADSNGSPPNAPWYSAYGDGSAEHPHLAGRTSRIYMAKNAISRVLAAYGEVRWGFARFAQTYGDRVVCPCLPDYFTGYQDDVLFSEETRACTYYAWASDIPSVLDRVCYNYTQGTCNATSASGNILVSLGDDSASAIERWVNHSESVWPDPSNPEIRAYGGTPLGGSLLTIRDQIRDNDLGSDALRGCRPYTVIVLTDGDEGCGGSPSASAVSLRTVVNDDEPCTTNGQCDSGLCNTTAGRCQYEVQTYVIAFALQDTTNTDAIAAAGGTFQAIPANSEDELVSAMASIIASSIKPEWCNEIDDDCDDEIDEDFPEKGTACDNGLLGQCRGTGTYICAIDGTSTTCDITAPGIPASAEVCDSIDNDCDGQIDEGLSCPTPGPEMCNGVDDDLDFDPDDDGADDPAVGITCGSSIAPCQVGVTKCIGGSVQCCENAGGPGVCGFVQGPVAETCNNTDDDCDGTTDEGLAKACYPTLTSGCTETTPGNFSCIGLCRTGIHTCAAGAWGTCQGAITPQDETCDDQDNNCESHIDEGLGDTTCGLGICEHTVANCAAGLPQNCDPMLGAVAETCNNTDDDCNGLVDDGLMRGCYSGGSGCSEFPAESGNFVCIGVCQPGSSICGGGAWSGCTNDVLPRSEECNNLDDDCDNSIDEDLTRSCYTGPIGTLGEGICIGGTQTCSAGAWNTCAGEIRPISEVCNNVDDNCDGTVDNMGDLTCGVGICNHSVPRCVTGTLQTCDPLAGAQPETCNNIDDNCDGLVDQFYGGCYPITEQGCTETVADSGIYTCTGLCQAGSRLCTAGSWGSCSGSIIPVNEVCDGLDNNCNGAADEGLGTTTCGLGVCENTIDNCSGGSLQTCNPMLGAGPETCNGQDDDCDGVVDDGLLTACYSGGSGCTETTPGVFSCIGICRTGNSACTTGSWGSCTNDVLPRAEECNGQDDDCDGTIDEDLTRSCYTGPGGTLGAGACIAGTQTCSAGAWSTCVGEVRPVTETCNNVDDNCDGTVDNMGDLTCGVGICNHSVPRCVTGTLQTCDPLAGAQPETCNNVDDNCDGLVDQFYGGCYPLSTAGCTETVANSGIYTCTGLCQAGSRLCTAGSWGSCSGAIIPQTEVCDGMDNNCDGVIDEGFGNTTCGQGECEHTISNCSSGTIQTCNPMEGSIAETCNNLDDDCDGTIDDGLSRNCYSGGFGCTETALGSGVYDCTGICAPGNAVCSAGSWGVTCGGEVLPRDEECNGQDDDCDGSVDESLTRTCYTGPNGTLGVGTCASGSQNCASGAWGTCGGEVRPVPEVCNDADDDCNGVVDDMGQTTCGLGVCLHTVDNCVTGTAQVCDPMLGATLESCNALDDDCDGQIDGLQDGCYPLGEFGCAWNSGTGSFDCDGICSTGVRTCPIDSGAWGECENAVIPEVEICDGLDNNCDGQIDESLTEICYPPGSGPGSGCEEQVDGTWICQGICAVGTRECAAGGWGNCQGLVVPDQEICDAIDNDCDGEIDEGIPGMGQPCGGVGICAPGIRACIDGNVVCDGGGDPEPGLCDGLDNNCNGLVDEPAELLEDPRVGGPCGEEEGACSEGNNECINGALVCVGGNGPTAEICNGIDDDCNGEIDTGDICSTNEVCYTAECRLICNPSDEQACPAGYACIEPQDLTGTNLCYPQLAPCGGIYCAENEVCRDGACADPCESDTCAWFERCWVNRYSGQVGHETEPEFYCFDNSCSAPGASCPNGALCVDHACVDDPCAGSPCNFTTEYCVRSACETSDTCTYECLEVPFCYLGERWDVEQQACVEDACANVFCESGLICIDGSCETDPCYITSCNWGEVCLLGECVDDPCESMKCPSYTHCYVDQGNGGAWCEPNPGVWTPPVKGESMTSGGGSCSSNPGAGSSGLGFLGLLMVTGAFLFARGRRQSRLLHIKSTLISSVVAVFLLSSCQWAEYSLESPGIKVVPDAEVIPDAGPDADVDVVTCIPADETCDGEDNDCNGVVDDYWTPTESGGLGHFSDDPFNCGHCGNICAYIHAQATCVDGQCAMGDCHPNWYDFDDRDENGCETSCLISSGGQEICDGTDNDCNGVADDPWVPVAEGGQDGFMTDANNCGECGRICAFPNGQGSCVGGSCTLSGCNENYVDTDGLSSNGCECIVSAPDDSTCDGVDNDCSGEMDEDYAVRQCYTGMGCSDNGDGTFACQGQCTPGQTLCTGGREQCQNQVGPVVEICDGLDNDCDGTSDEGFNLQIDVNHCGACNYACAANAPANMRSTGCASGTCSYVCRTGFYDLDPGAPGCEYACGPTNGGVERCDDAVDNDCDGEIDEYNALTDLNNCGSCGYSCQANAPSNMDAVSCTAGSCNFVCAPSYYDYDPVTPGCETFCQVSNGGIEACDALDNDCNGAIDETFDKATDLLNCGACNYRCSDNQPQFMEAVSCLAGNCQFQCLPGHYNYDGLLSNGCEYACTVTNGGVEICDNIDNDCNGTIDVNADGTSIFQGCYTGPVGTEDVGLCHGGTQQCFTGTWGPCQGQDLPVSEVCDTIDNDCDGTPDEDFDLNTSLFHCGSCNRNCNTIKPPNTNAVGCSGGACLYQCALNTYDMDANLNVIGGNGCEYECTFTNGGVERCDDLIDNDCDGTTDEYNALTDVMNCGTCGNVCETGAPANMQTTGCLSGTCEYECMPNYYDYTAAPGCEYYCVVSNGGTEACDGLDNNCDGTVDEGVNITTDMLNCGSCGYVCSEHAPSNMTATSCAAGVCQFTCQAGHYDRDGLQSNGCEYACTVTNSGIEICDNIDNDCNGSVDVNADSSPIMRDCYTGTVGTEDVGLCHGGTQQCYTGSWGTCGGQVLPTTELCDTLDNDCNGAIDNGFDLNTNLYNCGSCNRNCNTIKPPNTTAISCASGVCQYACVSGAYDLDGTKNVIGGNGCEYLCTFTNGGVERCDDSIDNDCDGITDEYNALTDVMNCGSCGNVCETGAPANMQTTGCLSGTCEYECMPNYYDYTAAPGCEYYCVVSNGGTEACDGLDNDCDNSIDETFNTATDILNCGGCGYACAAHAPTNMTATGCVTGNCTFACVANTYNYDGLLSNGCEYACTVTNGGVEICDNLDNDCDGIKDEGVSGTPLEQSCYSGPGGTEGVGVCHAGTQKCFSGVWNACQGQVLPQTELCDTIDNDCDGTSDDGYDLNTNILNCGMCGNSCFANVPAHASVSACAAATCVYTCNAGYYDDDGDLADPAGNGCEYACEATLPSGSEDCNGFDDDCDGEIDEASDLIPPPLTYCKTGGACGLTVPTACEDFGGSVLWVCQYPDEVDTLAGSPNKVAYAEVRCDALDNDCNGEVDEDFYPFMGAPCEDSANGLCKSTGVITCKADKSGTECDLTHPGATPAAESCDGLDNDCDGLTDEPAWNPGSNPFIVVDDTEMITVGGVDVTVYTYEASRPSATSGSPGVGNPRACSRAGVLPWNRVTYAQAQAACALAGARLCMEDEWQEACEGPTNLIYPYGGAYDGSNCNGSDYLLDASTPTGDAMDCFSSSTGTWDMSGNLREWTMDYRGQTDDGENLFTLRGGSYLDSDDGLTCQFTGSVYVESAFTPQVGFRCCSTCGNGTLESDELCDDGNRLNGDGCDYLCAFTAGQTCGDGVRQGFEQCDDNNRVAGDGCSPSCVWDLIVPVCGNSIIEDGETCDDGNTVNGDGCESNCRHACGNGVVEAGETCDDGNMIDGDGCESYCRHCLGGTLDAFGYERCITNVAFVDISATGTPLGYGDDVSYSFPSPFTFLFYNSSYTTLRPTTNGVIVFAANTEWVNTDLPTAEWTAALMPYWDDLYSTNNAQGVWWKTTGTSPHRTVIVQWITRRSGTTGTNNPIIFQVQIEEGTNNIHFVYSDVSFGYPAYDFGYSATVGIQNTDFSSTHYNKFSYNGAVLWAPMSMTFYRP